MSDTTDKLEGDAAMDELARHEATVQVPVETLERWAGWLTFTSISDWLDRDLQPEWVKIEIDALLSTNAENGSGVENDATLHQRGKSVKR